MLTNVDIRNRNATLATSTISESRALSLLRYLFSRLLDLFQR